MATTTVVNPLYQSICGKTLSTQAELLSKLKVAIVDVSTDVNYVTGGFVVDLSMGSRLDTIIACEVLEVSTGDKLEYVPSAGNVASTGKLKIYQTGALDAPLNEKDNAEATSLTCKCRIFGF